ncbi:ATP-binding protein [Massilia sp. 9096]|uniref:ATP-binding protein n=1 Tax=Massilia sp. 9096 TaxID=1500894 RepID=UPI000691FBC0|nr:ATP-binding protein [Massilia sp. 9096]
MPQATHSYPPSFKAAVALEMLRGAQPVEALATRFGVAPALIEEWTQVLAGGAAAAFAQAPDAQAQDADFFDHGELARIIAENSTQGLAMMDAAGYCVYANKAWVDMTGYSAAELRSQPLHALVHHHRPDGSVYPMHECPIDRALPENFDVRAHEDLFFRKDGSSFHVACAASPVFKGGKPVATVIEIRDVTEQKRTEDALRQADRNKDEFIAVLAHELRNPLAPIRAAVDLFQMLGPDKPVLRRATEAMARQVGHITRLVDDLLDVARISRGRIALQCEPCDLARIVRQTAEDYRPTIEANGVELALHLPDGPLAVDGDATRLAQVVGNLLHNAAKFTCKGGRIEVRLERDVDAHGAQAVLAVSDNGAGMAPELVATLFTPFTQAAQGLGRGSGGLGLGLALVKGLVELHGGRATASSPGLGLGSTLTVRLPAGADALPGADAERGQGGGAGLRVVLIDDNRDALDMLASLLELNGHSVDSAEDGVRGMETVMALRPDAVVCDIGLPGGMDGYAVARAIRAEPALAGTLLIALSGYGQSGDKRKSNEAGFDAHLVKPIRHADLEAALGAARAPRSLPGAGGTS